MKSKIQLFAAITVASITSGCVLPDPYYSSPVAYGRPVTYAAPMPADDIIVPEVVIVEGGVRHDRFFYTRHPEYYHRDRLRYPERFAYRPYHGPGHYPGPGRYRGPVPPPPYVAPGRPDDHHDDRKHEDSKSKKKKHHDDDHHH